MSTVIYSAMTLKVQGLYPQLLKPLFLFKLHINYSPYHLVISFSRTNSILPKRIVKLWRSQGICLVLYIVCTTYNIL